MSFREIPGDQLPVLLAPDPRWGPWAVAPKFVVLDETSEIRCSGLTVEWCPMMASRDAGNAAARRDDAGAILPDDGGTVPWAVFSPETMPPPEELTSTVMRSIAVTSQITQARKALPRLEVLANALDLGAKGAGPASGGGTTQIQERTFIKEPRRQRRKRLDDDHYKLVAQVYRGATGKPRQAVAHHFNVSPATASDYLAEARARHLLPGTTRGVAAR